MIIRRFGVWSAAKLYAGIMATCGLIGGVFFALAATLGGLAGAAANTDASASALSGGLGAIFGVGAIIIFPILYGAIGLAAGAIGAALYNLFAGIFGGLEVEVQQ